MRACLLALAAILVVAISGCSSPSTDWTLVRSADVAQVSKEWKTPVWISDYGINTEGWEDSADISHDGNTLYFAYINIDLITLTTQHKLVVIGPDRDLAGVCKLPCGQFPRADTFYSEKINGQWSVPKPHPLTLEHPLTGFFLLNDTKVYFQMDKGDGLDTEIYYAEKINGTWQEPVRIVELGSKYGEDDPWVSHDDNEIYFWSRRPTELGGHNIFYSKKIDGIWQEPVMLPEPINSNANDMQPFPFVNSLYFMSDREGKPEIFMSAKEGEGWINPEVVVKSKYGVGEPTLTDDGKYLYFVQLFALDEKLNLDIMYAEMA